MNLTADDYFGTETERPGLFTVFSRYEWSSAENDSHVSEQATGHAQQPVRESDRHDGGRRNGRQDAGGDLLHAARHRPRDDGGRSGRSGPGRETAGVDGRGMARPFPGRRLDGKKLPGVAGPAAAAARVRPAARESFRTLPCSPCD